MRGLGFGIPGVAPIRSGTHFCALYSGPVERDRLLYPFLDEGLRRGDKCLCLTDDVEPELVRVRAVGPPGPDFARRSAQLDVERSSDAYLRSGQFSVDARTSLVSERIDAAIADQFDHFRAAGEMSWVLSRPPGGDDLFVYESLLNRVVPRVPATLMCMYDLKQLGADMLVEVLRTHPQVLLDGTWIDNSLYLPPGDGRPTRGAATTRPHPSGSAVSSGERGTDRRWASLTEGELRVVTLVAQGLSNRRVAEELHLSRHTIDAHLKHVYLKLDIHSRVELTVLGLRRRLPIG